MNRQTIEGGMKEGLGAERITEERKATFVVSQTSGSTQLLLKCHEYVLYQVIHPAPLFLFKLYPSRGTLREDKRKLVQIKNVRKTKKQLGFFYIHAGSFVALEDSLEMTRFYPSQ